MSKKLLAKPVVKNKFWVLEEEGKKVGSVMANDSNVTLVKDDKREHYPTMSVLAKKYNIKVDKKLAVAKAPRAKAIPEIYGYPVSGHTYNVLFDVKRKFAVYTKTAKSKSYYCAGWYLIKEDAELSIEFCPKLITISRHDYFGPFKTQLEAEIVKKSSK